VEKQKYYIFWVCVSSLSYPACKVYAPYYKAYSGSIVFLSHYLIKGTIFGKSCWTCNACFDSLYSFCLKHFLFVFAKLRKATLSFAISVRLSVRIEQLGFHWTNFQEILYLSIFRKSVEKIQVSLKSDKNNGHFTRRRPIYIYDHISLSSS
jgi:hypothetical protein